MSLLFIAKGVTIGIISILGSAALITIILNLVSPQKKQCGFDNIIAHKLENGDTPISCVIQYLKLTNSVSQDFNKGGKND